MRSIAITIGTDEGDPGGPGPVYADGSFSYVPRPEPDPTVNDPTYRKLGLTEKQSAKMASMVAEMNPEFVELPTGERYTFAREPSEDAHRIQSLEAGDVIFFAARLCYRGRTFPTLPSIDAETGLYLIGQFTLAGDPITVEGQWSIPRTTWDAFETNAHRRRKRFDARVMVIGDPVSSGLYERVLPVDGPNLDPADCLPTRIASSVTRSEWGDRPVPLEPAETEELLRVAAGGRGPRMIA